MDYNAEFGSASHAAYEEDSLRELRDLIDEFDPNTGTFKYNIFDNILEYSFAFLGEMKDPESKHCLKKLFKEHAIDLLNSELESASKIILEGKDSELDSLVVDEMAEVLEKAVQYTVRGFLAVSTLDEIAQKISNLPVQYVGCFVFGCCG